MIIGGESGPGARECDVKWIRSIVKQCKDAGVPCFVKQLGKNFIAWNPVMLAEEPGHPEGWPSMRGIKDPKGGDPTEWPADLRVREVPTGGTAKEVSR